MSSNRVQLILNVPGDKEQIFTLKEGQTLLLGRDDDSDIVINDRNISRTHARFDLNNGILSVLDAESLNGTFINGERIELQTALIDQDEIIISTARIVVNFPDTIRKSDKIAAGRMTSHMQSVGVTFLLAKISNYEELTSKLPTNDLAELLFRWNQQASRIILENGGRIDDARGPRIKASWTDPKKIPAANAAIETTAHLRDLVQQLSADSTSEWQLSICIASSAALQPIGDNSAKAIAIKDSPLAAMESSILKYLKILPTILLDHQTAVLVQGKLISERVHLPDNEESVLLYTI